MPNFYTAQGSLQIQALSALNQFPIENADILIFEEDSATILEEVRTDASGLTDIISLGAPPLENSFIPGNQNPYAQYQLLIQAEGYEPVQIRGSEIFAGVLSTQPVRMQPLATNLGEENIYIGDNTLLGNDPAKIPEEEVKPGSSSGEIVLSRVVVPETIVVHDGSPSDASAPNYYVPFRDYIKNVACSEIYTTWPRATLVANILAILSFTLNRVYTEWYRNRGYDFTITSSTAYDHKWIYGRNYFQEITVIVDEIFNQYLSRPDVKQPILTQYCDGRKVNCPGWMTQWGSKDLGDQGYSPIEILRYYYGPDMYINVADEISGIPSSWPGENLSIGSSGSKVRQLQEQLLAISEVYSAIPSVTPNGQYDEATANAVREFQDVFGLGQSGITDFPTWFKISEIYVGISGIAELR